MWTEPVDDSLVRLGVALFATLAILLSVGRSVLFALRHRERPIAPPRDGAERVWYRAFQGVMVAIAAVCTIRLLFPSHYGLCGPIAPAAIRVVFVAGLLLTVAGFGIALVAQSQMGRSWRIGIPGERTALVTAGLYRTVRNPIYSGFLAATLGLLLMLPSIATMAILVASAVVISRWVAREEMHQLKIHGDSYREYCKTAGRYLPRLR